MPETPDAPGSPEASVPPIEPTPAAATQPPAAYQAPPQFAPPQYSPPPPPGYGQPVGYAQQAAQPQYAAAPRKRMSKKAVGWIIAGSILGFAGILAVIAVLAIQIGATITKNFTDAPLATGETATPYAQVPFECDNECFGYQALSVPFPSDEEFNELGLTEQEDEGGGYPSATVESEIASSMESWRTSQGTPEACAVTYMGGPVTLDMSSENKADRLAVFYNRAHFDPAEENYFVQSERFFGNSDLAVIHMEQLDKELNACTIYSTSDGVDTWTETVTRPPALTLPHSVAAVGWVESGDSGRFYAFDLQRGNYVVRTTLRSIHGLDEEQFRGIVERAAQRVAEMDPQN